MSRRWPETWPAPAKLNLMLRIVGRRDDGYHLLQTVFQFLDIGDSLSFRVRDDGVIRRLDLLAGVAEEDDLAVRAAKALQRRAGCGRGADIALIKRLPMGGGLGGGSSDAATTLVALDRLWGTDLGEDALADLAMALGADVPVFVRGRAAWAEGVGEKLTPVTLSEPWYLVVSPPVSVSTAAIFKDPELTRNSAPITIADFVAGETANDCLAVVCKRYPQIAEAWSRLETFGEPRLTGTGACLFVDFADEGKARAALEAVAPEYEAFVARGRNESPLHELVEQVSVQA